MNEHELRLNIQSPRGTKTLTFPKSAKIAEVIEAARVAFGFAPGVFVLRLASNNETLAPERTLVSYKIDDNDTLVLIPEMGSGV
jgi:hypothetical protein